MKTRQQKEETVALLQEKLARAKALVFTDYKGMNMNQLSDLRNKLSDVNAEFIVTKNTLLKKAMPEVDLKGPTATLMAYDDQISPIKVLVKAFKDLAMGKVKNGFLGMEALDESKIIYLSTLPSKDELRGKVVGVLVAPLTGLVSVLNGNLRNLVYVLDGISRLPSVERKSKGGE